MPSIRLENVAKRYGDVAAANLDLEINDGEYMCILGPTGAGKTTCMRIICGLTHPDSGNIYFDGENVTRIEAENRDAAMLSQVYSLFPQMNVRDNVLFGPRIKGWPENENRQLAKSMLRMVHLESRSESYPHQLSGGMQQRIALARALASGSKILLLDEPLRALDARLRIELRKELRSLAKEMGLTAIHVTHDQDEAMEMADRIAIIRHGKIIQVGTPREIYEEPATPFVANFMGQSNILAGTVTEKSDDSTTVMTECGAVSAKPSHQDIGSTVAVAVKVGNTRISKTDEGYIRGKITRILYEGAMIMVETDVPGAGIISSKLSNRKYDEFAEGDDVSIAWSPLKASVFDIPEHGLEEELRVD